MARTKLWSAWELPNWRGAEIGINRMYMKNGKEMFVIVQDERMYHIAKPKNYTWKNVKPGDTVIITKVKHGPKNARLQVHQQYFILMTSDVPLGAKTQGD